ncbi:hypothetical protein XENOCAPTIV_003472, partial [Xenoophorus captivus]
MCRIDYNPYISLNMFVLVSHSNGMTTISSGTSQSILESRTFVLPLTRYVSTAGASDFKPDLFDHSESVLILQEINLVQ